MNAANILNSVLSLTGPGVQGGELSRLETETRRN